MTFGICGLIGVGWAWLNEIGIGSGPVASRTTAAVYGAGAALTLDEFALWLNLQDDYWTKEGRESIDAVVAFGSLLDDRRKRASTSGGARPARTQNAARPVPEQHNLIPRSLSPRDREWSRCRRQTLSCGGCGHRGRLGAGSASRRCEAPHNSNKLALRLLPCDVLPGWHSPGRGVRGRTRDWHDGLLRSTPPWRASSPEWSRVSMRGTGLRSRSGPTTSRRAGGFTSRLRERARAVACRYGEGRCHGAALLGPSRGSPTTRCEPGSNSELADSDRELLGSTLRSQRREVSERSSAEQLLHGEPHAGNLLRHEERALVHRSRDVLPWACRVRPRACAGRGQRPLRRRRSRAARACRLLVLAMVAAWRWDPDDQFPNGKRAGQELLERPTRGSTVADTRRRPDAPGPCLSRSSGDRPSCLVEHVRRYALVKRALAAAALLRPP